MRFCLLLLLVQHTGCTATSWKQQTNNGRKQPQTNSICKILLSRVFPSNPQSSSERTVMFCMPQSTETTNNGQMKIFSLSRCLHFYPVLCFLHLISIPLRAALQAPCCPLCPLRPMVPLPFGHLKLGMGRSPQAHTWSFWGLDRQSWEG